MKKTKLKLALFSLLITAIFPTQALGSTFNFGNTEIKLSSKQENIKIDLQPGKSHSEEINITNHFEKAVSLKIYITDTEIVEGQFVPNNEKDNSPDLKPWTIISERNLEIGPGQTKTFSIKISPPDNAGIGKHYGAIMISQKTINSEGDIINFEKGIRMEVNILGEKKPQYKIINSDLKEGSQHFFYSTTILNSGNTDLKGEFRLFDDKTYFENQQKEEVYLKPGEEKNLKLKIEKTTLGHQKIFGKLNLSNLTESFVLNERFNIPLELFIFFLIATFGAALFIKKSSTNTRKKQLTLFALLTTSALLSSLILSNLQNNLFKTDTLNFLDDIDLLTTVKWGNLKNRPLPENLKANWSGSLKISSGKIHIVENLHTEENDLFYLNSSQNTLFFKNITGPDNDGLILLLNPAANDREPTLTYRNDLNLEEYVIPLDKTLKNPRQINYKQHVFSVDSEIASTELSRKYQEIEVTTELPTPETANTPEIIIEEEASENIRDLESTPDIQTETVITTTPAKEESLLSRELEEEISILREIIKDIPSSPDILSEYIFNSRLVQKVISEERTTSVIASPILINKLQYTPTVIQEISSSPDLNFIFIPDKKIKMAPQQFSFSESRTTSQELDEIIFVQSKNHSWSAYVSVSDFISLDNKNTIPSSYITISPGPVKLINQTGDNPSIQSGIERRFFNSSDQITLVNISSKDKGETIFSLKPKISVTIPANTPPGTYRAEVTIKAI